MFSPAMAPTAAYVAAEGGDLIRNALLTLISLIFCALALIMLLTGAPDDRLMGIGCLCFFGGCALIGASLLSADLRKPSAPEKLPAQIVRFHFDRWFHLAFGLASWGMTAGAVIFALRAPIMWIAAGPALIVFGLGGALLLGRAMDRKPVVTIDAGGVIDRRIMSAPAPWPAIEAAGFPSIGPIQHLQLIVNDARIYRRTRKGIFAWTGRGAVSGQSILIAFQGLDATLAQALAAIGAHKPGILILGDFNDDEAGDGEGPEIEPEKLAP